MQAQHPGAQDVLEFWFGDGLRLGWPSTNRQKQWFGGGAEQDELIRQRFSPQIEQALQGGLSEWEQPLADRLALLILLDQFSRNIHRGQARAFAGDSRAQQLVLASLALGHDQALPVVGRVFFYMPLMHAESLPLQTRCVACFTELHTTAPPEWREQLAGHQDFAREHLGTIEHFGRFPHRNAALGRISTPEETAFLTHGPRYGQ
jgi:uncharacterized protein (DUF924 family)